MNYYRVQPGAGLKRVEGLAPEKRAVVDDVRSTVLQTRERVKELRALIAETYRILEIFRETLGRSAETRQTATSSPIP